MLKTTSSFYIYNKSSSTDIGSTKGSCYEAPQTGVFKNDWVTLSVIAP